MSLSRCKSDVNNVERRFFCDRYLVKAYIVDITFVYISRPRRELGINNIERR